MLGIVKRSKFHLKCCNTFRISMLRNFVRGYLLEFANTVLKNLCIFFLSSIKSGF